MFDLPHVPYLFFLHYTPYQQQYTCCSEAYKSKKQSRYMLNGLLNKKISRAPYKINCCKGDDDHQCRCIFSLCNKHRFYFFGMTNAGCSFTVSKTIVVFVDAML